MGLFEHMERVKLRFISVCESLETRGKITAAQFDQVLEIMDSLDEFSEDDFMEALRSVIGDEVDFLVWDKSSISRKN